MLKKISSLLLIALILTAVPAGAALAMPQGEEQIVKQEVIMGHFDIWKGSDWLDTNNDGDRDKPGQTGKPTKPFSYDAVDKLGEYELTRVVVQYPFTPDEYIAAGGRIYGPDGQSWIDPETGETVMSWKDFNFHYLRYLPQNLSVQITSQDLTAGKATVKWGLDLIPQEPDGTLDLKDPENRQYIGYEPADIGSMVEGWRWYLPAIMTWYGVPKATTGLDLAVTSLESGVPAGEKAQPGQEYTGTVIYENLSSVTMSQPAAVKVTHQGYAATLKDRAGNTVTSLTLAPGESDTLTFTWHGPTNKSTSTLKATINLPPDAALPEKNLANNEKTVTVPVDLQNLKIRILTFPESAKPGDPVSVSARVFNQSGELVVTRLVIKINGKVVSDKSKFDVIGQEDVATNFTMPDKNATVEFTANPDKNKPANETNWSDNSASCTVKRVLPPSGGDGSLKVSISAPTRVEPFKRWDFSVTVSGHLPPPPPDSDEPDTANVSLNVTGSSKNMEYRYSGGTWGDIIITNQWPVDLNKNTSFRVRRGEDFTKKLTFTFPASAGYPGRDMAIPLKATAKWRDYKGSDSTSVIIHLTPLEPYVKQTL